MSLVAPPVDSRTAVEIERQLVALLKVYAPAWSEIDPISGGPTGASAALIGVFARFAELTLQRLNQAPEKNELAFLDMIGAAPLPAQPARAPLTFLLAPGAKAATVPARTQVAAPASPAQPAPLVFETLREVTLTPATLARVMTWDAQADRRSDHSASADPLNVEPVILFRGEGPREHTFYISQDDLLGYPMISGLGVFITLATPIPAPVDPRNVQWEIWDGDQGIPLTLQSVLGAPADSTLALTQTGEVTFADIEQVPLTTVNGVTSRWLRCRLTTPVSASDRPTAGFVRASQLPVVVHVSMEGVGRSPRMLPDAAFLGATPLDVSKDFYPFGPDPKFGATWYIASRQVLTQTGRRIGLYLAMSDPASGIKYPGGATGLTFKWEYFTAGGWTEIGSATTAGGTPVGSSDFIDGSAAFTGNGEVSFVLQTPSVPTVVNGVQNYWLRIRLVGGGFTPLSGNPGPAAPSLTSAKLYFDSTEGGSYTFDASHDVTREDAISYLPLPMDAGPTTPAAFAPAPDPGKSVYLGIAMSMAAGQAAQLPISLWADLAAIPAGANPDDALAETSPQLTWTYWDGANWSGLVVADDTEAFTASGEIRFIPPADLAPGIFFETAGLCWLRATWTGGDYRFLPRLRRLLINTTLGEQAVTVASETLGSSSGEANQVFTAAQSPLFDGVALDVIEPEWPAQAERAAVFAVSGEQGIAALPSGGVRVRWLEVGDFYGSGARDRHFVVDHGSAAIHFGDGINGLIPPQGSGNLVLANYRTGSGALGDVAAGSISQLKTTLPYVSGVTNPVDATGGVGAEDLDDMRERAPRLVRHGGRAVTVDDFQDLSKQATPEVAHSLCVPLRDLILDPEGVNAAPGTVSVIIVPNSPSPAPTPSVDLVERVSDYLAARASASASVVVVGPEYVTVDVEAQVSVTRIEGAGAVEEAVRSALANFLHPLTGGADGTGWDFGRRPHKSDIYTLIQSVDGVDHLRGLTVIEHPAGAGTLDAGRFLVCSGVHRVDLSFGSL